MAEIKPWLGHLKVVTAPYQSGVPARSDREIHLSWLLLARGASGDPHEHAEVVKGRHSQIT